MKDFAVFLWKNRLLPQKGLTDANGKSAEIHSPGAEDIPGLFSGAKLKIDGEPWCGSIEISISKESDSRAIITATSSDKNIQLAIPTDRANELFNEYRLMAKGAFRPPCEEIAARASSISLHDYLTRLLVERIEEKADRISRINEACDKRWDHTLFKLLARSYGFGIQGKAFEEWAMLLDIQALAKHRNSIEQIEAIMYGQAGLLEEDSIPAYYRNDAMVSDYYCTLVREYKFLKSKFNLQQMEHTAWGYGNSAPHIRIARLAMLFHNEKIGITAIAACNSIGELRGILQSQPGSYWQHHTQFGSTTTNGTGDLSNKQLDVLIINTVVPILYSYGKHRQESVLCNKAEDYLYELGAESNSIVRRWTQQGVSINCAADSQALIQLNNSYCKAGRCRECRFAHAYFKESITNER